MCLHVLPQMREKKHVAEQWTLKSVFTGFGIMLADSCISFIWAWFEFFQIWTDGARGLAVFFLLLFLSQRGTMCFSAFSVLWLKMFFFPVLVNDERHHENTVTLTFPCQLSGQIIWNKKNPHIFKDINHRHTFCYTCLTEKKVKIHKLILINSHNIIP